MRKKFNFVWPLLDERTRRIMAASESNALGYGGVSLVSWLDQRKSPTGRKVTVEEMKHINISNKFHGEWNYMIKSKAKNT